MQRRTLLSLAVLCSCVVLLATATLDGARRFSYLDGMSCLQQHDPALASLFETSGAKPLDFNMFLAGLRTGRPVCQALRSAMGNRLVDWNFLHNCAKTYPNGARGLDAALATYECLTVTAKMEIMATAASREYELADEANTHLFLK